MSIQFGKCNLDGRPVDHKDLDQVRPVLASYGLQNEGYYCKDNLGILIRPLHATKESRSEVQPHISASGHVITWDGRLDNRDDLLGQLAGSLSPNSTDLDIVAAAYERWGSDTFRKLIGDWALSVSDLRDRSIILAKDFMGTRHLYYSIEKDRVTWCTILDPLVLFAGHSLRLEEEYIAGWLSFFPATHLTPYTGIHSVPPSCFVCVANGMHHVTKYWDFDPAKRICYGADSEYEEHFRVVFATSVRRRLRSDHPVLAELSGGVDSSAVVCVADTLFCNGTADTPRLDTVSYYDDSEPNWNERPYFRKIEEKRGRTGCHIDVSPRVSHGTEVKNGLFAACPASQHCPTDAANQLAAFMVEHGHRVLLSGIGGDEVTGGVPTPTPELANLIATARLRTLAHQLKVWALNKRKPWFQLLWEATQCFFASLCDAPEHMRPAPWLQPGFIRRYRSSLTGYPQRIKVFGPLPSFQSNLHTLAVLQRQLSCDVLPLEPPYEKRFPFLDRELLEFLFALPPEQLVRPGQRRSLVRRALVGIVPSELLNRRRKAFAVRAPIRDILSAWNVCDRVNQRMTADLLGLIETKRFLENLSNAQRSSNPPIVALQRTILVETWLSNLLKQRLLSSAGHDNETVTAGLLKESRQSSSRGQFSLS